MMEMSIKPMPSYSICPLDLYIIYIHLLLCYSYNKRKTNYLSKITIIFFEELLLRKILSFLSQSFFLN